MIDEEDTCDFVTLSKERVLELAASELKLQCLEQAGVDNWEGYEAAMECFNG